MCRRPSELLPALALLLPALVMVGLLFVYPLVFSLTYAFRNESSGGWDLGNFSKAFALYGGDIALTAIVTVLSTALVGVLADEEQAIGTFARDAEFDHLWQGKVRGHDAIRENLRKLWYDRQHWWYGRHHLMNHFRLSRRLMMRMNLKMRRHSLQSWLQKMHRCLNLHTSRG